jgi:MFS family permease
MNRVLHNSPHGNCAALGFFINDCHHLTLRADEVTILGMFHTPPALNNPRYRAIWIGFLISVTGSQMQVAALHWQIRELTVTPNPLALGGIGAARFFPIILFSLIGGTVADTFNRRWIIFTTQSVMAIVAALLAYLTFKGTITIWIIYLLTAVQASAVAFDLPARQAMIPNLVSREDLPNAFSMTSIAMNTASIIGPALGGIVIASLGQGYVYLINSISFLALLIALFAIGPVAQDQKKASGVSLKAIRDGVHFIVSKPIIFSTMILDFFATFFASANTMMPIVARDILHVGEVGYGWLVSAESIGSVAAGLALSQIHALRKQGPLFLVSLVVFGTATILFGLSNTFMMAMIMLIILGAADTVSTIIRNTIRQLQTPDHIRGRMTSINQIFFQGGPQLGEVEAGVVAQLFGVPFAIISGGVGTLVAVWFISRKWPQLRTYDGTEPQTTPVTVD